jgi:hypothetical protein
MSLHKALPSIAPRFARRRPAGRRFELTEQTREAVDAYLKLTGKRPGEFLFPGRGGAGRCMTTRQYARLVSRSIGGIGLNASFYGYALAAPDEGDPDLPSDREPAFRAVAPRAHQDREHGPIPRHRGR